MQLWTSDGTTAGTVPVLDVNNTANLSASAVVNGVLYFTAADYNATYLYRSDGTASGTYVLKQWPNTSFPPVPIMIEDLYSANGRLFFTFNDGTSSDDSLWVSDGTGAGTKILVPGTTAYASFLTPAGSRLFFQGDDEYSTNHANSGLWVTDGTPAGTHRFSSIIGGPMTYYNGSVYFNYNDGVHGGRAVAERWHGGGHGDGGRPVPRGGQLGTHLDRGRRQPSCTTSPRIAQMAISSTRAMARRQARRWSRSSFRATLYRRRSPTLPT